MNSETMKRKSLEFKDDLRNTMDKMLGGCTLPQRELFHRLYNYKGEYARDVDGVRDDQMDCAFGQIEKTLAKNLGRQ